MRQRARIRQQYLALSSRAQRISVITSRYRALNIAWLAAVTLATGIGVRLIMKKLSPRRLRTMALCFSLGRQVWQHGQQANAQHNNLDQNREMVPKGNNL